MPNYRRLYIPGGCYFFTVNLHDRTSTLLTDEIDLLRSAYAKVQAKYPFKTLAICVLPDHLHAVWSMPEDDPDFSMRWRLIKTHFTKSLPAHRAPVSGRRLNERAVWQRRFWEHSIRDENDLEACIAYVHGNPVKHGLVSDTRDWPYSNYKEEL